MITVTSGPFPNGQMVLGPSNIFKHVEVQQILKLSEYVRVGRATSHYNYISIAHQITLHIHLLKEKDSDNYFCEEFHHVWKIFLDHFGGSCST